MHVLVFPEGERYEREVWIMHFELPLSGVVTAATTAEVEGLLAEILRTVRIEAVRAAPPASHASVSEVAP